MFFLRLSSGVKLITALLLVAFALTGDRSQSVARSDVDHLSHSARQFLSQAQQVAQRQRRTALVIGNANYELDPLANPLNDASDVARALREMGYEVILRQNLDLREMEEAIEEFNRQLRQSDVGVFYYAGHGVQVEGENYLIPLEAQLNFQKDVRYDALPLGKVLNAMDNAEARVNIVILDACRDNPFYRQWQARGRNITSRGLTSVELAPQGTLIAFATSPGNVAEDGTGLRNSPFTSALLQHIKSDIDVGSMFRRVRETVLQTTNEEQIPWVNESLIGYFSFPEPPTVTPKPQPPQTLISSATGVNYTRLRDLLAERQWREADEETNRVFLIAANREKEGSLRYEDIENFPCEDLRILDRLWLDYSERRFGFSVQKEIYQTLGGTREYNSELWRNFGDQVGWRADSWLDTDELTFGLNAPLGHLPNWGRRSAWDRLNRQVLFSRAETCNL
jgi:uncharacterized caspase-like protein